MKVRFWLLTEIVPVAGALARSDEIEAHDELTFDQLQLEGAGFVAGWLLQLLLFEFVQSRMPPPQLLGAFSCLLPKL